jgi:hypothetical protein
VNGGCDRVTIMKAEDIISACDKALALAPTEWSPTLPVSPLFGAPEWYSFEHEAWDLGECVRQAFSANRRLKRERAVLERVVGVATCRNLRRGRQSFVMALGFVDARDCAPELAPYLSDLDVKGQVVSTLLLMRAPGFATDVVPLLDSDKTWIRNLARRYLERFPQT